MFKRLFWFSSGAATGAAGSVWVRRRIQRRIEAELAKFTPGGMRDRAVKGARRLGGDARVLAAETKAMLRDQRRPD